MFFFKTRLAVCFVSLCLLYPLSSVASGHGQQYTITGKTMGTVYAIKFISNEKPDIGAWEKKVVVQLKDINKKLSMFDPESEVSRFNRHKFGQPLGVSKDFHSILTTGKKLHLMTDGAWDGTLKPLVDLWGFGTKEKNGRIPATASIEKALAVTGYQKIQIISPNSVLKIAPLTLDLGSIAKGYGVDKIADLFISGGIKDLLVEIGGELYASGKNKKGLPWGVGISRPVKNTAGGGLFTALRLNNQAIATSGDYRNYFEKNGRTYSHVLDPRTGFPVETGIVSASVISDTCTFSDGLATALMVMDPDKGLDLVNRLENTECLLITQKGGQLESRASKGFNTLLIK